MGSSARISLGRLASALTIAARCCWPPESSFGLLLSLPASPTLSSNPVTQPDISPSTRPLRMDSGINAFSMTLNSLSR